MGVIMKKFQILTLMILIVIFVAGCNQTKVSFNENKEKEKIEKLLNEHFDAVNWRDEETYLKTINENSKEFYDDRVSFFRKNVQGGSTGFAINVSTVETEVRPNSATSKIRIVVIASTALLGEVELKNTIYYNFNKVNGEWKISGFANQEETSSANIQAPILNFTFEHLY